MPHVVAVQLETAVYDNVAREFARMFYLSLVTGRTVREAFQSGRAAVAAMPGLDTPEAEAEKFLLLPESDVHDVAIFDDASPGSFRDITPAKPRNNLPAIPEHFIGRNVDTQRVVLRVTAGRLVTVCGAPGIGKTALAIAAARYLNERRTFPDGVFFVSANGAHSAGRIGDQESIVGLHSVNTSAGGGGVRWYEFRVGKDRNVSLYQQGTYAPDAFYRWMASPAIDRLGNIGIGYSFGGTPNFAGQRFAGRLAKDPLGQLTLKETVLVEGEGAQNAMRWEDYTQTAIDPSDDCTIWYVGDYIKKGAASYSSRIGAFRMPGCKGGR